MQYVFSHFGIKLAYVDKIGLGMNTEYCSLYNAI